jgi:hypothetical protein
VAVHPLPTQELLLEALLRLLELDRRGGLFTEGRDVFGCFAVEHASAANTDWAAHLDGWLRQSLQRRGLFGATATTRAGRQCQLLMRTSCGAGSPLPVSTSLLRLIR